MNDYTSLLLKVFLALFLCFLPLGAFAFTIEPVKIRKSNESSSRVMQNPGSQPGFSDCVKYMGYRPIGADRFAMRFFNSCPDRVNINICVAKADGSGKLYKSIRRVPIAGNMDIYTLPGDAPPRSIQMAYGYGIPTIPPPCSPASKSG